EMIRLYPEGGWTFLRQPELDAELVINGDPRAKTHAHGDCGRGSFELWWRGAVLIREPGNPTYTLPARHWYRSGQGQNVTCVDGLSPGISHEYQERMPDWYCEVQDGSWHMVGREAVVFCCRGFRRLPRAVDWQRQWMWKGSRQLVMEERLEGRGSVQLDSYLHLGDAPWQQVSAAEWQCPLPASAEHSGLARMTIVAPAGTAATQMPARFAPEYGIEKQGSMLVISGNVQLPIRWSVAWEFE
ncbi:MAG: heparinase II/III-family protein, partial [Acidobacteria bacterium]|nr:heparinase II/III-family protein [Acidobacteriota bacterium]